MSTRIDSLVSHGKGVVKQFQARLDGLVGVFSEIAKQHGEVSALLARCRRDPARRADLWPEIRRELISHERAEMRVLYPELRMRDGTRTLADHHDQEAMQLESMIGRLDAEPLDSNAWGQVFERLVESVLLHATEEEKQIFPAAQHQLGDARARELEAPFLAAKKQIMSAV